MLRMAWLVQALDDVVDSKTVDDARFQEACHRTLRWIDRCIAAHKRPTEQNLFGIVQGGLDVSPGGLRDQCLEVCATTQQAPLHRTALHCITENCCLLLCLVCTGHAEARREPARVRHRRAGWRRGEETILACR